LYNEQTNKEITRRDIAFDESSFLQSSEAKQHSETLEVLFPTDAPETMREAEIQEADYAIQDQQVHRSGRAHDRPDSLGNWVSYTVTCKHFVHNVCEVPEPKTIDEALSDLLELPEGREAIGCRWVFKVKHDSGGKFEKFKGRLVAKGYSQKYGIDFEETFALVICFSSIRTLLEHC